MRSLRSRPALADGEVTAWPMVLRAAKIAIAQFYRNVECAQKLLRTRSL